MLLSLASPVSPQLNGGTIYLLLAINPGLWPNQTGLPICTHYKLKKKKKKEHRWAKSALSFLLTTRKWSVLKSFSPEFSLPAGIFMDTEKFLNKQGIRRGSTNTPVMGRWWADVKKPTLALKFSLPNRDAMEIFTSLSLSLSFLFFFFFFGKWTVIGEIQTVLENDGKPRSSPAEQQLSLGGITGLGKYLYMNLRSCNFLSAVYHCHGRWSPDLILQSFEISISGPCEVKPYKKI